MDTNTDKLFEKAFDMSGSIIYYPVRHHSPACSYHLEKTINEYRPDCILIEGPADADRLIPYLVHKDTVPPVCIYYSYDDKKGLVDETCEKYRAYYPFLEYSPEMTALKKAAELGADVHFIDIPYGEILVNEEHGKLQFDLGKDGYDSEKAYTEKIVSESGCRNFSEFWESRFETSAMHTNTKKFVKNVMALGYYMRQCGMNDETYLIRNKRREKYMADNISAYSKGRSRTLVIAGAYHTAGLLEPDNTLKSPKKYDRSAASVFLMPYTFFETDSKSGYGAGIPFPSFYRKVWNRLFDKKTENTSAYEETVLEYIVKTAKYTRSKHPVSMPDEINAFQTAKALAELRNKHSAGVYELIDGVRSTFVKGDIHSSASFELDFLLRQLTGMGMGKTVSDENIIPPVIADLHEQCRKYHIKTNTIAYQEITLETVKKPLHYEKSCFLHQMEFLNTGFCKMLSGADYVNSKDTDLIREQWRCRYGTDVETALTDLSVFGGNISQICSALIDRKFRDSMTSCELGKILIHIHVMGMDSTKLAKKDMIFSVIQNDSDFIGICRFISSVKSLMTMHRIRHGKYPDVLDKYMSTAFESAVYLLDSIKETDDEKLDDVCRSVKMLYSISMEHKEICSPDILCSELEKITKDCRCKNQIYGIMTAVLFKNGRMSSEEYSRIISAYLETAGGNDSSLFLCGIFMAARDILLSDSSLLYVIDNVITNMPAEEFASVLPFLRYAFTNFIPAETERISRSIANIYETSETELSGSYTYSSEEISHASLYDSKTAEELRKWGLI